MSTPRAPKVDAVCAALMALADEWALEAGAEALEGAEGLPLNSTTRDALEAAILAALAAGTKAEAEGDQS